MEKAGRARKTLEVMNGDVTNSRDRAGAFRPQVSRKTVTIPMHIPQKRQNRRMAFMAALFLSLEPFNVERLNRAAWGQTRLVRQAAARWNRTAVPLFQPYPNGGINQQIYPTILNKEAILRKKEVRPKRAEHGKAQGAFSAADRRAGRNKPVPPGRKESRAEN